MANEINIDQLRKFLISEQKEVIDKSEKVVNAISDPSKSDQYGFLTKNERSMIFRWKAINSLLNKDNKEITNTIKFYELLSKSQEGKGLDTVAKLFSTDILQNTNNALNPIDKIMGKK